MDIEADLERDHLDYEEDVRLLSRDMRALGLVVRDEVSAKASHKGYGLTGPCSEIVITLDAGTVKQLLEYSSAFIGMYMIRPFVKAFFKELFSGASDALGKKLAKGVLAGLRTLWNKCYAVSRRLRHERRHAKTLVRFKATIEGVPVSVDNVVNPDRVEEVSGWDAERALTLLFVRVLPSIREEIVSQKSDQTPEAVHVTLELPARNLDRFGPENVAWRTDHWHWHVLLVDGREYVVLPSGRLRHRK
jgi:hypothetical protein